MDSQNAPHGTSPHGAARRAVEIIDVLVPRPGSRDHAVLLAGSRDERAELIAVLRAHGETGSVEISDTDLAALLLAGLRYPRAGRCPPRRPGREKLGRWNTPILAAPA
jgi:hypothetical protein